MVIFVLLYEVATYQLKCISIPPRMRNAMWGVACSAV